MSTRKKSARGLQEELASFLEDVLELARDKTGLDSARLEELKQGFQDRIEQFGSDAGAAVRDASRNIAEHAEEALDRADTYAHEKPWHLVLAAGLIGLAVGVLVTRR